MHGEIPGEKEYSPSYLTFALPFPFFQEVAYISVLLIFFYATVHLSFISKHIEQPPSFKSLHEFSKND